MSLFKALKYFDIPVEAFMETDERLSDSQRIVLILTWRAVRQARREILRRERRKRESQLSEKGKDS